MKLELNLNPELAGRLQELQKERRLDSVCDAALAAIEQHFFDQDVEDGMPFMGTDPDGNHVVVHAGGSKSQAFDDEEQARSFLNEQLTAWKSSRS